VNWDGCLSTVARLPAYPDKAAFRVKTRGTHLNGWKEDFRDKRKFLKVCLAAGPMLCILLIVA
jgi:hypothetical protein